MLELFREIPSRGASRFSIVRPAAVNLPPIGPDDILAPGYERSESGAAGTSVVLFYDVRSAASPTALDHLTIERTSSGQTAGAVGLSRDGASWLLLVANWDSDRLDFYRSD